jgi:hypothetical protein
VAGVERCADGGPAPSWHVGVACLGQAREAWRLCVHRPARFLQDEGLRRSGPHDCGEPPEVRWPPMRLAWRADSVTAPNGCAPQRGGGESAAGLVPGTRAGAAGLLCPLGHRDGGASARACQTCAWSGGSAVRGDAITGLLGQQRGRDDPAGIVVFWQGTVEPVTTRPCCRDDAEGLSRRWPLTDAWIPITLTGPKRAHGGPLGTLGLSDRRPGTRLLVDLHAKEACASLRPGGPPRGEVLVRHQAALASGKRTRVPSGGNLPPLEVIMSRLPI